MPRIVFNFDSDSLLKNAFLASGDKQYFLKYGIPLINSFIYNNISTPLIINCIDFRIKDAVNILALHNINDSKINLSFGSTSKKSE